MEKRYVELEYEPKKEDLIATFRVEPLNEGIVNRMTAESSTGTWTHLTTANKRARERLKGRAFEIDKERNIVKIAYKRQIFEKGNIPQMLSDFAGNIFGMKALHNLRLVDVKVPQSLVQSFLGPSIGLKGIRKKVDVTERPLLGTIVKPKLGLNPEQHAEVAYQAWRGGCDLVKDDENLTNQEFCRFKERVRKKLKRKEHAEAETGETKIYAANITAPYEEMVKRAEFVKQQGGNCIMVDLVTAGFSALQSLATRFDEMLLYGHRAMHAAFTRKKKHGIKMLVIAKLARLAGVDHLHTGAAFGKMEGEKGRIKTIDDFLRNEWYGLKQTLPVKSGGLHPGLVPHVIDAFGREIQVTAGGGIHGAPGGTREGAKAMRQAIDAKVKGVPLKEYAKDHQELQKSLDQWGMKTYT